MSEIKSLDHAFEQAAKEGKSPRRVHVHETTHRRLSEDVYARTGYPSHEAKRLAASDPMNWVTNPHAPDLKRRDVEVVADDVPEGRYFFSDDK